MSVYGRRHWRSRRLSLGRDEIDDAYSALTDANAMEFVKQGQGEIQRAAALMNNVVHNNEMFGTAAVYMRAKGMVPPSTERAQGRAGGDGEDEP